MNKITPFLWFDGQAEEAINFYCSIFKNSKIESIARYPESFPMPGFSGKVMTAEFVLDGQKFMAIDGGPNFKFTEAISMYVNCETQEEVDDLWDKLGSGGKEIQCGWLTDKYGLAWQIIPRQLPELLQDPDKEKAARVMDAMMKMVKIDIAALEAASKGE